MTLKGLPRKLSADTEAQSQGHVEGENEGVALRGTNDDGQPDPTGPQLGLGLPPAHSPLPFFLPKGSAALRWPVYGTQPVRGRRGPGSLLRPCHGADSPTASPPGLCFLFVGSDSL